VEDQRAARWVRDEARAAKERLSRAASVAVPIGDTDVCSRATSFEMRARPSSPRRCGDRRRHPRRQAAAERIVGVFLVGGASRMPLVGTLLFRALNMARS
jgi:molecular chaperone DnaK (HSP70)